MSDNLHKELKEISNTLKKIHAEIAQLNINTGEDTKKIANCLDSLNNTIASIANKMR